MGMLPDLPVTMGSLTLHIDCMVTKANNYHVLIGNDWLRMAGADLLLSSGILRVRLEPERFEDIRIDTDGGPTRLNIVQAVEDIFAPALDSQRRWHDYTESETEDSEPEACESDIDSDLEAGWEDAVEAFHQCMVLKSSSQKNLEPIVEADSDTERDAEVYLEGGSLFSGLQEL